MCELGDLENAHFATIFKQSLIIHAKKDTVGLEASVYQILAPSPLWFSTRMSAILKNLVVDMQ